MDGWVLGGWGGGEILWIVLFRSHGTVEMSTDGLSSMGLEVRF